MTAQPAGTIPQWTMADRLRKAREAAGLDQSQLALIMGTARNTISNYEHANTTPRPYILKEWALVTGVPLWWIKGETPPSRSEPTDLQHDAKIIQFPGRDSNPHAPLIPASWGGTPADRRPEKKKVAAA